MHAPRTARSSTRRRAAPCVYGALAARGGEDRSGARSRRSRRPRQFTFIGRPLKRLDVPLKVNGTAQYGIDTRLPGMVYARDHRLPGLRRQGEERRRRRRQEPARRHRRGARCRMRVAVVRRSLLARPKRRLPQVKIEWDTGAARGDRQRASSPPTIARRSTSRARTARNDGDAEAALKDAAKTIEAVYEVPYLAACAAWSRSTRRVQLQGDELDLWIGTQDATRTLRLAATRRRHEAREGLHPQLLRWAAASAGAAPTPRSAQAIAIAKAVGKPVKLV